MYIFKPFYILAVLISISVNAQDITGNKSISRGLVFESSYTSNGLPDNRIRSIYQSKRGYFWIGTMNGLAKYDGYTFTNFSKENNGNGIAGNWVYDITEDSSKNIWIATTEGVSKLISVQDTIINYTSSKHLTHKEVRTLYIDDNERVWIGTKKGLSIYNTITEEILKFEAEPFNNTINSIIKDKNGHVWVSCETGLVCFNPKNLSYTYLPFDVKSNPYGDRIWDLYYLNNEIWIGTGGNGLYRFNINHIDSLKNEDIQKFKIEELPDNIEVFDIKEGPNGSLWLATGKGLIQLTLSSTGNKIESFNHQNNNKHSLSDNLLYKLYFDTSKNLLIGSDMGLNILLFENFNFQNFDFSLNKDKDAIRGLTSTYKSNIVVASNSKGLFNVNPEKPSTNKVLIKSNKDKLNLGRSITSFEQTLFVGTLDGVLIKELNTGKESQILSGENIFSLAKDPFSSKIYIGAINGLYIYDIEESKLVSKNKVINGFTRAMSFDKDGSLWVGIDGPKLYVKKRGEDTFEDIEIPIEFHGFEINGIEHDSHGNHWIGTVSGLNRISKDGNEKYVCEFIGIKDGLIVKMVNGLIADSKKNIWLSTIKGITKYDIEGNHFEYYLPNLIFIPSSVYKQNNESFLFGHTEGFIKFNPTHFSKNQNTPNIQITSLRVLNEKIETGQIVNGDVIIKNIIEETSDIVLNHKNNIFTIEYSDLNRGFDENRQYAYKLEGFDEHWNYNKRNQHSATYTNLDPGKYTFMIKIKNQEGEKYIKKLMVKILPSPWKSGWAILTYILLLLGVIFLFMRFRVENLKNENLLLLEKTEKEQIKHLNDQKLRFFTNISHEFRTPVTLILGPIKEILNDLSINFETRNKARIIEKNGDKLTYLIDELITFRELGKGYIKLKLEPLNLLKFVRETASNFEIFAEKKGVLIGCHSTLNNNLIMADPLQFYKVINNLIINALKFCPLNSSITIKISKVKNKQLNKKQLTIDTRWICLEIINQGVGISKDKIKHIFDRFYKGDDEHAGTGIGLSICKEIVELHQGLIEVESEPENTRFIVILPKGRPEDTEVPVITSTDIYHQKLKPESLLVSETIDIEDAYGKTFGDFEKKNILLVDDNSELLEYLHILLKTDYHIDVALNGEEALEIIKKKKIDLIVSDVVMPKMDGIELCEQLKSNAQTMYIPIILLSAKTIVESKIKGIESGADDYIDKPFHPDILKTKIDKLIQTRNELVKSSINKQNINFENINSSPADKKFLQNVIDLINENMGNDDFSVEELSDTMAMSRSNLFRKMKQMTNMSPISFIYYIRLQKAVELLLERKSSVSEIAWKVGYKNPASFSKSFKTHFGKSPTEYLNDLINKNI